MFITFEGIDGSGKSSQIELLHHRLERAGHEVVCLRDPGGAPLSERIRSVLLDPAMQIAPFAEMLLFSAARTQLVEETILPALKKGKVVISDRFYDSTTAYQGIGRGIAELEWLVEFHRHVTGGLVPDRTYFLDLPLGHARMRLGSRSPDSDRMERSDNAFYQRVIQGYHQIAASEPDRLKVIDAMADIDEMHLEIWNDLVQLL
jgi:dTMP kinase